METQICMKGRINYGVFMQWNAVLEKKVFINTLNNMTKSSCYYSM